jgi:hypothetical protein
MNIFWMGYWLILMVLSIFSYGFIDLNLQLSKNPIFLKLQAPLSYLVFHLRPVTAGVFMVLLISLFCYYIFFLIRGERFFPHWNVLRKYLLGICFILVLAFPAFTYDIFNYITTAKVTFYHQENPYVVMPIEIPNEPYLAFTRAANKYALYGPVWILLTGLPHVLGVGNIWLTIIAFKGFMALGYLAFCYFIFRVTRSIKNVLFFALNPLVVIEVLVSGHNDIYMMLFALCGLYMWKKSDVHRWWGAVSFLASWFIKGATLVLSPLFLFPKMSFEKSLYIAYWLLFAIFIIVAPLREELYPWYAVWIIAVLSLLPLKSYTFMVHFTIVLSLALELRHIPYMWMGYYGGPGPALRIALTVVPVFIFLFWWFVKGSRSKTI